MKTLILIAAVLGCGIGLLIPVHAPKSRQPYVALNTEEELHRGDLLAVYVVSKDTIWLTYPEIVHYEMDCDSADAKRISDLSKDTSFINHSEIQ